LFFQFKILFKKKFFFKKQNNTSACVQVSKAKGSFAKKFCCLFSVVFNCCFVLQMKGKERKRIQVKAAEEKVNKEEVQALNDAVQGKASIEATIASIEEQREFLGDEATDAALQPLADKLVEVVDEIVTHREKANEAVKSVVVESEQLQQQQRRGSRGPPRQQSMEDDASKYKEQGSKAFGQGKYQQAFEFLSQAIARTPNDAKLWSMRALTQLRMERWPDALRDADQVFVFLFISNVSSFCLQSVARDKDAAESHCRRALALYQLNLLDEALKSYDAAAAVNTTCPELKDRKLVVNALSKRNQGTLRRIINQSKAGEEAEKSRDEGVTELKKGDLLKALEAFTKVRVVVLFVYLFSSFICVV
jgi:tetratricopeptide (TPR) repeat protein